MRTLFLADAHLRNPDDLNYRQLLAFLGEQLGQVDTLVLLGDIFDFWVGYQYTVFSAYIPILDMLGQYRATGTEIIYVEGNHDFHIGPYFQEQLGARILPDGGGVKLDGRDVYLAHGDLANPADRGYMVLRKLLRSWPTRLLIRIMPPDLTWQIAASASRRSKLSRNKKSRQIPAREILLNYASNIKSKSCQVIITGHFHQPFHEILEDHELVALGDWINQFSYAVCENGHFELKTYTPPAST